MLNCVGRPFRNTSDSAEGRGRDSRLDWRPRGKGCLRVRRNKQTTGVRRLGPTNAPADAAEKNYLVYNRLVNGLCPLKRYLMTFLKT